MSPSEFDAWLLDPRRRTLVMGVLNVTPDSFSDGGQFLSVDAAVAHAETMAAEGADIIDVGGESTRPGSEPVDAVEQIRRIRPVLEAIRRIRHRLQVVISVDTTRAAVAESAVDADADIINDISAGRDDPEMFGVVARLGKPIILMHMRGTPANMQIDPTYQDLTEEVSQFLRERMAAAMSAGVDPIRILVDPGIGFGKTADHNLELLRNTRRLAHLLGRPVVVGASRKSFIGKILGPAADPSRSFGTAATVAWAVANEAAVVRVHDVGPMVQVVRMLQAIVSGTGEAR